MGRWRAALVAGVLVAAVPAAANAMVYTMVGAPLTVTQGVVTTFAFTFTNVDLVQRVGCMEVLFPDDFWISGLGTPSASNGSSWSSTLNGQWVLVYSNAQSTRLLSLQSVTFTVTALPTMAGAFIIENHVHTSRKCTGTNLTGVPPLSLAVLPAILPTAAPTATPTRTPTATPVPTATALPAATPKPTSVATARPTPVATPDASTPTPSPTPASTPRTSPSERPTPPGPAPSTGGSIGGSEMVRVATFGGGGGDAGVTDNLGVGVDVLDLFDSPFEWIVPGAPVALPGLLVIVFVGLQAVGALAWIPAVRRMSQESGDRRKRPT